MRNVIAKYEMLRSVGLNYKKNEPKRVCEHHMAGCPWKILISTERNNDTFGSEDLQSL